MIYTPYPYQDHAANHVLENPAAGLLLDMGLGKTVSVLTAIVELMKAGEVKKTLVIAPKLVAQYTWPQEIQKWEHLKHLKTSVIVGTEKQRKEALKVKADVFVINRENVVWLVGQLGGSFPFDLLVIDESSSFKSAKSARFKALRTIRPAIKRVIILTGTPTPNGLLDLWPQIYLLDRGERLGKSLTAYRDKYFKAGKRNGFTVYDYDLRSGDELMGKDIYEQEIYEKIGDICISMKKEDYLDLPKRIDRDVLVRLPADVMRQYQDFEREQVLALADEQTISAVNAAALTGKLLQYSNGAVYGDDGELWHEVHKSKLEALEELVEAANGNPVLIFYWYRHDLIRIVQHLRAYRPVEIKSDRGNIEKWNKGEIPVLLAHPASAGHGLNLQAGGHNIVWFCLPWSLELYQQANARLDRQGQIKPVINQRIIVKGTMDEDVLKSLDNKAVGQDALMEAVKARIDKYKKLIA